MNVLPVIQRSAKQTGHDDSVLRTVMPTAFTELRACYRIEWIVWLEKQQDVTTLVENSFPLARLAAVDAFRSRKATPLRRRNRQTVSLFTRYCSASKLKERDR